MLALSRPSGPLPDKVGLCGRGFSVRINIAAAPFHTKSSEEEDMDPSTMFAGLREMVKLLPDKKDGQEKAKALIQLLEQEVTAKDRRILDLQTQLGEATKERDKLKEDLAAVSLTTEEYMKDRMLYRKTPRGEDGPFCPNCRTVHLSRFAGDWMCPKCSFSR